MKPTPLQIIKDKFGSRAELAKQLSSMVDKMHGDSSTAQVKSRLLGLSNPKLLRLYAVEQTVRERFGSKDKLVDAIVEARLTAGHTADESFRTKISGYSKARLLDLTRQKLGARSEKLTDDEKAARRKKRKKSS
ncbi:MAG: hypothetical protein KTR25_10740 [Myxococcales bacterium]|nr:hypothetical protein [Myxococcales bacterium]